MFFIQTYRFLEKSYQDRSLDFPLNNNLEFDWKRKIHMRLNQVYLEASRSSIPSSRERGVSSSPLRAHPGAREGGRWRRRPPFLHLSQASSPVSRSLNIIYLCMFRVRGEHSHWRWRCHLQNNNNVPADERQTPWGVSSAKWYIFLNYLACEDIWGEHLD